MAIALADANFSAETSFGPATTGQVTIPGTTPAGALICLGFREFTDLTTNVTQIADSINGTWGAGSGNSGPTNDPGGTSRSWFYYRENSGSGSVVITVTFGASIQGALVAGYATGALTSGALEEFDPTPAIQGGSTTSHASDALTADNADGAMIGFLAMNSSAALTAVGSGETDVTGHSASLHFIYEPYSTTGSKSLSATSSPARRSQFHVGLFIADTGGGGGRTTRNSRSHPLGIAIGTNLRRPLVQEAPMARETFIRRRSGIFVPSRYKAAA